MNARTMAKRALSRGYTAVEVLMAMTVLAIGASGVIGMQRAAVQGNDDARNLDVANAIAREWTDRLHRDSSKWTSTATLTNAKLISGNVGGDWFLPNVYNTGTVPDGTSAAFDVLGRDLGASDYAGAKFCVHVRLNWLVMNELVRAEVRVFWIKGMLPASTTTAPPFCTTGAIGDITTLGPSVYNFVQVATAVRRSSPR